jgi:hypothetical protein
MNSLLPDNDMPHMPAVLRALKDLAAHLTALERELATSLAALLRPHPQLPNTAKKSNFPPPNPYY